MFIQKITETNPAFGSQKLSGAARKAMRKALKAGTSKPQPVKTVTSSVLPYITAGAAVSAVQVTFSETINNDWFKLGKDEAGKPFVPDIFQKASGINILQGNDVLVTAPTGTGKTAIAHFAINKNLAQNGRTLYTTPLKALSNEKFKTFRKIYGDENVGIMTGDTKINTNAPIVIMTTEIYRNMVFGDYMEGRTRSEGLKNVKTVIFDELHYLGDIDRGGVWEQAIMFTPNDVQLLSLSATIGNNRLITDWMASIKGNGTKYIAFNKHKDNTAGESIKGRAGLRSTVLIDVPKENRHVPLEFIISHAESRVRRIQSGISKAEKRAAKKEQAEQLQSITARPSKSAYSRLIDDLCEEDKLPAILFIFSKNHSKRVLDELNTKCECLNSKEEIHQIYEIIKEYESSGKYLGESLDKTALYRGYALHNAGLLPSQKELIEELFQKKLVKVVIATETLSAGINMPARTTVISTIRKPSDHPDSDDGMRGLTPNDFHQMAGRAGRRGIDKIGYCYALSCNPKQKNVIKSLISSGANDLKSSFVPDYSFLASYYSLSNDDEKLKEMMSKSLNVYDTDETAKFHKQNFLFSQIEQRKNILKNLMFMNKDNYLTPKGELLKHLNGYIQIPVIEFLSNDTLLDLSPVQLCGFIGILANMERVTTDKDDFGKERRTLAIQDEMLQSEIQNLRAYLKEYTKATGEEVELDTDTAQNIYRFAELNSRPGTNSVNNWSYMYNLDPFSNIEYEGLLFRQITTTIDLLKQIYDIVDKEFTKIEGFEPQAYELRVKLLKSIELLNQDPVKI